MITCEHLCQLQGEGDEVFYAEAFGAEVKDGSGGEVGQLVFCPVLAVGFGTDQGLEGVSQSLAALVEAGLDDGLEQGLVTAEVGA